MKTIQFFLFALILTALPSLLKAQNGADKKIQEAQFKVNGVCGMCEARIEEAALIKGVKMVDWDKDTQLLTIVFNKKKTNLNTVHEAVAKAGHDTETTQATDEAYKTLPGCCQYRDGVKVH